jgi:hypothetical protein
MVHPRRKRPYSYVFVCPTSPKSTSFQVKGDLSLPNAPRGSYIYKGDENMP